MPSGIQYDERGRPYLDTPRGRNYISPVAMGGSLGKDDSGFWHAAPSWNQYSGEIEKKFEWGKLVTMVTAGILTAGAANALLASGAVVGAPSTAAAELASIEGGASGLTSAGAAGLGAAEAVPALGGTAAATGAGAAGAAAGGAAETAGAVAPEAFAETGGLYAQGAGPGMVAGQGGAGLTSGGMLGNASRVGQVLNGINSGRQQGREAEAAATTRWDQNANTRYRGSIEAADLNLGAGTRRASQSVRGDILANAKPFEWTGDTKMVGNTPVPQFTGGINPTVYSQNTRDLGSLLSEQALAEQRANQGRAIEPQDPLTGLPKAGTADKILGGASTAASLLSAINYGRR